MASVLLPRRLRPHVAAVYAFARAADDFADEGDVDADARLAALNRWEHYLDADSGGLPSGSPHDEIDRLASDIFPALHHTMRCFGIDVALFRDLLDAFRQDCTITRYESFPLLLDYCRRSANPVGRIMLALFGVSAPAACAASDALCTGLQLANFWQDVSIDAARGRIYIPLEDLRAAGLSAEHCLPGAAKPPALRDVLRRQVERTRLFFDSALPLFSHLRGLPALEIRAVWLGGSRILDKIARGDYTAFENRPTLTKAEHVSILFRAALRLIPHR